MWYILKFEYTSPPDPEKRTKTLGYSTLPDAHRIFDQLEHGYQFYAPVRVQGDKKINVTGVWLYASYTENYDHAVDAANSGSGILVNEARALKISLDD